jgi:hypothetical protein
MRVLITASAGQIGQMLHRALAVRYALLRLLELDSPMRILSPVPANPRHSYVIHDQKTGWFKIRHSHNPEGRQRTLTYEHHTLNQAVDSSRQHIFVGRELVPVECLLSPG